MRPTTHRILLFVTGLVLVPGLTYLVILFARGYRPDFKTRTLSPTGILVVRSDPDASQIFIDGRLTTATNANLNLPPGRYTVEIKKEGFSAWKKLLSVQAEIVTRAEARLFPSVPSLKALTAAGTRSPLPSPDGSKVAFLSNSSLYILDLTESPLGLVNRDPKIILENWKLKIGNFRWSPDSRQVLASASNSAVLVDVSSSQTRPLPEPDAWEREYALREKQKFIALPEVLQHTLATSAAHLSWSPNEKKLLYTATASAAIPDNLIKPLPGSSTQSQNRQLIPNRVYVYDTEEDRNFEIDEFNTDKTDKQANAGWAWFPTSSHLYRARDSKIVIRDSDDQNSVTVYAGPMQEDFAFPYPSGHQLLILTNLNPTLTTTPNLYALSLR